MLEIPRPQSRKVTSTLKARMQVVAYRLAKVDPARRQRVDKLLKRLPGFSESQIRLRLRVQRIFPLEFLNIVNFNRFLLLLFLPKGNCTIPAKVGRQWMVEAETKSQNSFRRRTSENAYS